MFWRMGPNTPEDHNVDKNRKRIRLRSSSSILMLVMNILSDCVADPNPAQRFRVRFWPNPLQLLENGNSITTPRYTAHFKANPHTENVNRVKKGSRTTDEHSRTHTCHGRCVIIPGRAHAILSSNSNNPVTARKIPRTNPLPGSHRNMVFPGFTTSSAPGGSRRGSPKRSFAMHSLKCWKRT